MKVKNLHEINTVELNKLWKHRFYPADEEIEKYGGSKDDYFLLTEAEVQVEGRLRGIGLKGEEKEKLRIELLREFMKNSNYDVESFVKMYLDSDMTGER